MLVSLVLLFSTLFALFLINALDLISLLCKFNLVSLTKQLTRLTRDERFALV